MCTALPIEENFMDSSDWSDVALAAITFVSGGGAVALLRGVGDFMRQRKQQQIPAVVEAVHEIYSDLNRLLSEYNVERTMVALMHNHGQIPTPGKPILTTILYEVAAPGTKLLKEDWQQRPLDASHLSLLVKLVREGHVFTSPEELGGGPLRDTYEAHNVGKAEMIKLCYSKTGMYYLAIHYRDAPSDSAQHRTACLACAERIAKNLFCK